MLLSGASNPIETCERGLLIRLDKYQRHDLKGNYSHVQTTLCLNMQVQIYSSWHLNVLLTSIRTFCFSVQGQLHNCSGGNGRNVIVVAPRRPRRADSCYNSVITQVLPLTGVFSLMHYVYSVYKKSKKKSEPLLIFLEHNCVSYLLWTLV